MPKPPGAAALLDQVVYPWSPNMCLETAEHGHVRGTLRLQYTVLQLLRFQAYIGSWQHLPTQSPKLPVWMSCLSLFGRLYREMLPQPEICLKTQKLQDSICTSTPANSVPSYRGNKIAHKLAINARTAEPVRSIQPTFYHAPRTQQKIITLFGGLLAFRQSVRGVICRHHSPWYVCKE